MDFMDPIHRAALDGDVVEITRLVKEDRDRLDMPAPDYVEVEHDEPGETFVLDGCTPLMMASFRGHVPAVKRLLALGADRHGVDADKCSAVHWACYGSRPATLAVLLDAGCLPDEKSVSFMTPLMAACHEGAAECVHELLRRFPGQIEVNAETDHRGETGLHFAADDFFGDRPRLIRILLAAGSDPTIIDKLGRTPYDCAKQRGNMACAGILREALLEPRRARWLFKARALVEAGRAVTKERADNGGRVGNVDKVAPAYLKERVEGGEALPVVGIKDVEEVVEKKKEKEDDDLVYGYGDGLWGDEEKKDGDGEGEGAGHKPVDEECVGVVKAVVGMREDGKALLPELFVELVEYMLPAWDPSRKDRPLGEGMYLDGGKTVPDGLAAQEAARLAAAEAAARGPPAAAQQAAAVVAQQATA